MYCLCSFKDALPHSARSTVLVGIGINSEISSRGRKGVEGERGE
jgi:hypothetical protein